MQENTQSFQDKYGAPQVQQPKRGGFPLWGKILAGVGGLVIVSCVGCGILSAITASQVGKNITATETAQVAQAGGGSHQTGTQAPGATATSADTGDHSQVGGTIEITAGDGTDVAVTLVSAKSYASAQYTSPKAGNVYVVCDVKIENKGTASYDYNEFDFFLLDGHGNIGNTTYAGDDLTPHQLNSGTLTAGGSVEGQVVFEAPQGDHAAQMTWQPTYSTPKDKFTWALGL